MLAVALIPLAALTALVGADLTAVNQSTVDAARTTIIADARDRESVAASDGATSLSERLGVLTVNLGTAATAINTALASATPATIAVSSLPGGASGDVSSDGVATVYGRGSPAVTQATAADGLGSARPTATQAITNLLAHEPELSAAWVYNSSASELVAAPLSSFGSLRALLASGQLDPGRLLDPLLNEVTTGQQQPTGRGGTGRPANAPVWSDVGHGVFASSDAVTVWLPLSGGRGDVGAELPISALAGWVSDPVSTLPDSWVGLIGPGGTWLFADPLAASVLSLPPAAVGQPAVIPGVSTVQLASQTGGVLRSTEHGAVRDLFTAPLSGPGWTLVSAVPENELAPTLGSLGDGIRNGVRSILLLQVLPLAIVLAAVAVTLSWLFARRLVGPVRALTASAERLAQGHTDEPVPRQGTDEVGLLSDALERMRAEVNTQREELLEAARELEQRVVDRTAELSDRNEELVALNALGRTLTRSLDPDELAEGAVRTLSAILPARAVAAYTTDGGAPTRSTSTPLGSGDLGRLLDRAAVEAAATAEPSLLQVEERSFLGAPVRIAGETLGVLVAALAPDSDIPDRLRTLVGAIADQLALALRTAELSAEGRELAVLEERTRLAREIHDTIAQQLTGIVLQLEATATLLSRQDTARSSSLVIAARDQARLALAEARRSVWNLRPVPLDAAGLAGAVTLEVERLRERTGIKATVRNHGVPVHLALPPQAEVAVFRILQEALSNIARHSRAANVEVSLRAVAGDLHLTISDDGRGFDMAATDDAPRSFGLVGMRERAALIGAQFTVTSAAGAGTVVALEVPLQPQTAVADA